ncbi:MAG TPA: hypothetical protein VMV10_21880, partial [Pirellulales bacterium]|nr:hypothetical protein [Pirellulales bacterium]
IAASPGVASRICSGSMGAVTIFLLGLLYLFVLSFFFNQPRIVRITRIFELRIRVIRAIRGSLNKVQGLIDFPNPAENKPQRF